MATTTNQGNQIKDKAKDATNTAIDKASDFASQAADKASEYASKAGDKVENAASSVGSGMKNLAESVREHTPNSGVLGAASEQVASGLEAGGKYLEDKGLSGMSDDLAGLIKNHPIPAVLIGIGIGYLIASATNRS